MSSPRSGYEERDARTKPLLLFALGLAVLTGVSMVVSGWIDTGLTGAVERRDEVHPMTDYREAPDEPVLQASPTDEIAGHRAEVGRLLSEHAWVDRENGVIRIPIDRALELVAREGLPVREEDDR